MQLLDCFGIPVLMALSWFILYARYRVIHFVAVAICLLGVGTMVGADIVAKRGDNSGKTVWLLSGSAQRKVLLKFSLLFFKYTEKCRKHVLVNYLFNFIFRFTCFWYSNHFHKALFMLLPAHILVPFCHTGFVSFHEINFFIYLQSPFGTYTWISY